MQAENIARPELVREVQEGKRHEARVSWWGFDAKDSTSFLQSAINSKVKKLIIDKQASAWITSPLNGVSDQEIIFEEGAELVALRGAFHPAGDCMLSYHACSNVIIRGESKNIKRPCVRMRKADYQSSAYEKSEWRHGLNFLGCRKVRVQDLTIEQTGGDGIYLGTSENKSPNVNVVIRRVDCNDNHRQGISIISAEDLLIEDCLLRNTDGTDPKAGIDFEPNDPSDSLVNCVLRGCIAENNAGTGFQICPQSLSSRSKPISIYLKNCVSRNNKQHAVHLCSNPKDPVKGLLRITHLVSANDGMAGLSVQFNPCDAVQIEMQDSDIRDASQKDTSFPPIYLQGIDSDTRPVGNIHFRNVTIEDDLDRPFIKIRRDGKAPLPRNITGRIILEHKGHKEAITLNEVWLTKFSQLHSAKP